MSLQLKLGLWDKSGRGCQLGKGWVGTSDTGLQLPYKKLTIGLKGSGDLTFSLKQIATIGKNVELPYKEERAMSRLRAKYDFTENDAEAWASPRKVWRRLHVNEALVGLGRF